MDYSILKPRPGYVVIKDVVEEKDKSIFQRSSEGESRAYGRIIALPEGNLASELGFLSIGELVCYDEYEGQELFKNEFVTEDHLIVIKHDKILLTIKE